MYGVPREFVSRTKSSTDALLNAPYSMPSNLSNNKLYRRISGNRAVGRSRFWASESGHTGKRMR
jgi:hypothetical protein